MRWARLLIAAVVLVGTTGPAAATGVALASDARSGVSVPDPPSGPSVRAWGWPLAGRPPVLRRFDPPTSPYGPGHRGVDLGGAPGDLVLAAGPGVVSYAGVLAGRGVVSVQHPGGLRTTYEPLSVTVERGAAVARGTVLGRLVGGHAGCPWAACLHWGLRRGDAYLDPLALLRRGPVRLLPLGRPAAGVGAWSRPSPSRHGAVGLSGPPAPLPSSTSVAVGLVRGRGARGAADGCPAVNPLRSRGTGVPPAGADTSSSAGGELGAQPALGPVQAIGLLPGLMDTGALADRGQARGWACR